MERAILMASGLGSRMRPLTLETPKPLITVGGTPMIETVIEGLKNRGVREIAVVVGYLKEKFGALAAKYPEVRLIENPYFETVNNISSIYVARDILRKGDCFVCEADLYLADKTLLCRELPRSAYFGKFVKGHSEDWVFDTNAEGTITRVGKRGDDRYNMVGLCFLKARDASFLADAIERRFHTAGYEDLFWDDVVNENLDTLKLGVEPVPEGSIAEIDTVAELMEIEKTLRP